MVKKLKGYKELKRVVDLIACVVENLTVYFKAKWTVQNEV